MPRGYQLDCMANCVQWVKQNTHISTLRTKATLLLNPHVFAGSVEHTVLTCFSVFFYFVETQLKNYDVK